MPREELKKLKNVFLYLSVWGIIFVIIHVIHMQFFVVDVIFYDTLIDLLISTAVMAGIYFFWLKSCFNFSIVNYLLTLLFGLSSGYIFAITVPTVIDRSLSAYILEKFVQRGGSIKQDALLDIFTNEFIAESRLMDIRLQEALTSGTIVMDNNGCLSITEKGRFVAGFTKTYRNTLLPKKRKLLDDVTDDLTDPFRKSPKSVNYKCDFGA